LNTQDVRKKIQRASLLMVVSILLSRLIGFVREWVIAGSAGATPMTDVYYASFTIPDFLNYLMAAGALSITFIPVLSEFIESNQLESGKRVYRTILTLMGSCMIVLIIAAEVFTEPLAQAIAPGFDLDQRRELVFLLRVILPAQFFFYSGGLAMAVQQAHGVFKYAALAPLIYNLGIILCGLLLFPSMGIGGFSVGVLVGAFFSHGVLQWVGVSRVGYSSLPLWDFSAPILKAIRKYFWLTFPLMLGFSLVATDEWISKYFASQMENRAISWMAYARTEMRIPVAVIGQAAGMASFPYMSRLWAAGNFEQYGSTLIREMMKLWALGPLSALLMYRFAAPLTQFIYGGSRLSPADVESTAAALEMFSVGIFFWIAQVVLARAFYAAQMTWVPSLIGGLCSLLAIPVYWQLGKHFGFRGLALSASVGIAVYVCLLWILLVRHLKRSCPQLRLAGFYQFAGLWSLVLLLLWALADGVGRLHLYQGTQATALVEVVCAGTLTVGVAWVFLRTVFKKVTDGPLF
jgi:putative peptidoglycan lipid II flippase